MQTGAGLRSLCVKFPERVRGNDYYRERHPELVRDAEQRTLAKIWAKGEKPDAFSIEMEPFLRDPFRGTVERRVLAEGEKVLPLELAAAREAIAKAGLRVEDVDLLLSSAFLPDTVGVGSAAYLARDLGLTGAAWNFETACSSSVVGLQTACGLVQSGQYRHVLVVISCTYSRVSEPDDTFGWFLGDGVAAFVVGPVPAGQGYLGHKTIHTAETCGSFYYDLVPDAGAGRPGIVIKATKDAGRMLAATAEPYLATCCRGAAEAAGVALDDVKTFVFNTPTAWYAAFAARSLGISRERTVSTYHHYANTGPVLMPANLHYAAQAAKLAPGDLVMLYAVGSVSSASAMVLRWSDVALGANPAGVLPARMGVTSAVRS